MTTNVSQTTSDKYRCGAGHSVKIFQEEKISEGENGSENGGVADTRQG